MYSKGEVVWAKIKGFPWWPGVVAKVQEDREDSSKQSEILVNFIGENSHARLAMDKVAKFDEHFTEYAKMKKKKLVESIEVAQRIINGETTYEEESQRLDRAYRSKGSSVENKISPNSKGAKGKNTAGKHSAEKDLESESDSESQPSHVSHRSPIPAKIPPSENKKKVKIAEKKEVKAKQTIINATKSPISTTADRTPVIVKSARPILTPQVTIIQPSPITKESDSKDSGKNRAKKLLKLDLELEDSRQLKVPQVQPITKTPADVITDVERRSDRNVPKIIKTQPLFEGAQEELLEMIINKNIKNLAQHCKKVESIIKKIDHEDTPVTELLEKDVGKNIYTILVLIDKLEEALPDLDSEDSEHISRLRDYLLEVNHIVKDRIQRHFVENIEYLNFWLRKLEDRADIKESDQETKLIKESESLAFHNTTSVTREYSSITNKGLDLESESSPNENNEKTDDDVPSEEEKHNTDTSSKDNDDKSKSESKNQAASSTKLIKEKSKTDSTQGKKLENKPIDPNAQAMRKKICNKMLKMFQDKYSMQKEDAQRLTLEIEKKVSRLDPNLSSEYKSHILTILKSIKYSLVDARELAKTDINFSELRKMVEDYQKENAGKIDNMMTEESLTLGKESKSEMELMNSEGVTVGVSN